MKTERFVTNMIDQILEAQCKLGYVKESIRLYYPLSSLNALLSENQQDLMTLEQDLERCEAMRHTILGPLTWEVDRGRLSVCISPAGVEAVHCTRQPSEFLKSIVALFQKNHHCTIEEIRSLFASFHAEYICEKMPAQADFDYCFRFKDAEVDEYYYCIKMEMGHTIYHRFMREDYEELFGCPKTEEA